MPKVWDVWKPRCCFSSISSVFCFVLIYKAINNRQWQLTLLRRGFTKHKHNVINSSTGRSRDICTADSNQHTNTRCKLHHNHKHNSLAQAVVTKAYMKHREFVHNISQTYTSLRGCFVIRYRHQKLRAVVKIKIMCQKSRPTGSAGQIR